MFACVPAIHSECRGQWRLCSIAATVVLWVDIWSHLTLELSTNLHEVLLCPEHGERSLLGPSPC